MTRSVTGQIAPDSVAGSRSPARLGALAAALVVGSLLVTSCGGGDDDADSSTTTTLVLSSTTTVPLTTTTTTTTTTLPPIEYVTDGATVVVANASGINGAAGRLTERLDLVGFTTAAATNGADAVGQLATSKIYFVADDAAAEAVANSLREGFGGGDITVEPVGLPAPTESGELGAATVLVLMGDDIADKSLDELQGRTPPAADDTASDDSTGDDASTDDTTTDDTSTDDTATDDASTDDTTAGDG